MSEFDGLLEKKFPYRITKTNWIVFAVAFVLSCFFKLIIFTNVPEFLGNLFGMAIGYLLFASLFGVIFWFLLGKKENGGSTTFNVLIVILFLGQLGDLGRNLSQKKTTANELNSLVEQYKEDLKNDTIHPDVALKNLTNSFNNKIDIFIEQSSGEEKETLIGINEFVKANIQENEKWTLAFSDIENENFFNFSLLKNEEDYTRQIQIAENFVAASKRYKAFFESRLPKLKVIFRNKKIDSEFLRSMVTAMEKKANSQNPIYIPYIDYNIQYGTKMIDVLLLARKNRWKLDKEGYVLFENSAINEQYNNMLIELTEYENEINELRSKFIELM